MNVFTAKVVVREYARQRSRLHHCNVRLQTLEDEREAVLNDRERAHVFCDLLERELPPMPPIERYLLALASELDHDKALSFAGITWQQDVEPLLDDRDFADRHLLASRPPHRYIPPIDVRLEGTDMGADSSPP